jgi:hypothetical protein
MAERPVISRRDAHTQGLKRFYTGKPCNRNHYSERFTSSGACIECQVFKTPSKRTGPKGTNVGWPPRGLVFTVPDLLPEEMQAAFLFIEAMGWHNAAVAELRKRPDLVSLYSPVLPIKEQAKLQDTLDQNRRRIRHMLGDDDAT